MPGLTLLASHIRKDTQRWLDPASVQPRVLEKMPGPQALAKTFPRDQWG